MTPSFNQGEFIEETIRSVLLQGYPNLEYVIMDGGSSDCSQEIIRKYEPWLKYWISAKDRGQSDAINRGFEICDGSIGTWLNSDDVFLPGSLAAIAELWFSQTNVAIIAGCSEFRDITGMNAWHVVEDIPTTHDGLTRYFEGEYLAQPSCFFSPGLFKEIGGLDEEIHYSMDLDLWLRLVRRGRILRTAKKFSWMREHAAAKTFKFGVLVADDVEKTLLRHSSSAEHERIRRQATKRRSFHYLREGKRNLKEFNLKEALICLGTAAREDPLQVLSTLAARITIRA